ncbi:MAG: hypothetical protein GX827_05390 [Clostridiales bacterium]|jgi:hypothetical protein|nr:hypothetical protein [Clostridiales bacterium]
MNIKEKIALIGLCIVIAAVAAITVFAEGYDTSADPLVTVSYIQNVKTEIKNEIITELDISSVKSHMTEIITSIMALEQQQSKQAADIKALKEGSAAKTAETDSEAETETKAAGAPAAESASYEVIRLIKGQTITADASLELIPRSGSLNAVVTSETNRVNKVGLSDLTSGTEILDGEALEINHYILVSRADGRGVTAVSDECYLMVRGSYTIVG